VFCLGSSKVTQIRAGSRPFLGPCNRPQVTPSSDFLTLAVLILVGDFKLGSSAAPVLFLLPVFWYFLATWQTTKRQCLGPLSG
jgi:hypothetical protein